jgi:CubicO group peptidase (beta-lactamase class C family)
MPGADGPAHDVAVTPDTWQLPPANRWAFWHVDDFLPTQTVSRGDGPVRDLAPAADSATDPMEVGLTRVDGSPGTVAQVLAETYTDAYVVLQDGALVTEWYAPEGARDRPHVLMSVSKSVVGCVAAALVDRDLLDTDRLITQYVPELSTSGYAGATVQHVLDMRSGVRFREDYTDPQAEVRVLDGWLGWTPTDAGDSPRGLYRYLAGLVAEAPHGGRFLYRSAETDVLGWVCERAGGKPMAELISTLVWQPMGAEFDAVILCDTTDTAIHDGGLCATARDVARFGQLLLDGGTVPAPGDSTRTVIGPRWLRQAWAVDADARTVFAASPSEVSLPGGWYRNQFWFRPGLHGDVLLCLGIYGQTVHVSRRTRTVCVKLSSWPTPQAPSYFQDTLRAFDAVGGALTGRRSSAGRRQLPGVVAGVHRHGTADRSGTSDDP